MTKDERALVLKELDELAALRTGEAFPEWMLPNDWGKPLSLLCRQAATLIREKK